MYRQGLGDFYLVTLPREGGDLFRILIDCGVILGTKSASKRMSDLMKALKAEVGAIDLLIVTHRHWDHVSGFGQAAEVFASLPIGQVWVSWVEDPSDSLGKSLLDSHKKADQALRAGAERMQAMGLAERADEVLGLLDFQGAPRSTDGMMQSAKALGKAPLRYCRPADAPARFDGVGANFYVLGPPPDVAKLGKMDPSKTDPETYGVTALRSLALDLAPAFADGETDGPFGPNRAIPLDDAKTMDFFQARYFDPSARWRAIDTDWIEAASALALAFDQAVNNTSLVLAIELDDGGDVLLFAADAQVGNWLSWQDLSWTVPDGRTVTGPDLLRRTTFYKVGHHASHNATLMTQGLESMDRLKTAMVSVDEQMAHKKHWSRMPFEPLLAALETHTGGRTVRADKPPPAQAPEVTGGADFHELSL
jgi:hypothetical protein